ncbi:MAG: hypothetical protein ACR2K6_10045 [Solirubrobacterales bacterium]
MADPYAKRFDDLAGAGPAGNPPWLDAVEDRVAVQGATEAGVRRVGPPAIPPAAIVVADAGVLAPLAWLSAEQAVMFTRLEPDALAAGSPGDGPAGVASSTGDLPRDSTGDLLRDLDGAGPERGRILMLKHGWVAGPLGEPGCVEVSADLLLTALDAVLDPDREVEWERDPDFGYEVPARIGGLDEAACRILCPRLHYADHDRVYEHAELVAATKRGWFERLSVMDGVSDEVLAATGWPPRPTGDDWRKG